MNKFSGATAHPNQDDFFVAGGTLKSSVPSYVERNSDGELLELITAGKFCYVLTARQMGKSSLMIRIAEKLRASGKETAIVDLTQIGGQVTIDEWYLGLVLQVSRQLKLNIDFTNWWKKHDGLSQSQRFLQFLQEVVLERTQNEVVIFVDEIDSTLKLDFRDDFFATIRAIYNARATSPNSEFNRLSFILLGVASPLELIQDSKRTPFNIGESILLKEFTLEEASVLQAGLKAKLSYYSDHIIQRIFYWSNGHPYLTQKLCLAISEKPDDYWDDTAIDKLVAALFFAETATKESNLQFVQKSILEHPDKAKMLKIYKNVLKGKPEPEDGQSSPQNLLRLAGVVTSEHGFLKIRNSIYKEVFNERWVNANTPTNTSAIIIGSLLVILAVLFGLLMLDNYYLPQTLDSHIANFLRNRNSSEKRLGSLAKVFEMRSIISISDYETEARNLFFNLSREEQLNLFTDYAAYDDGDALQIVIRGLYTSLADVDNDDSTTPLLEAMRQAIGKTSNDTLKNELTAWLEARNAYRARNFDQAVKHYDLAILATNTNPATLFERARVLMELGNTTTAADDLQRIITSIKSIPVSTPTIAPSVTITPIPKTDNPGITQTTPIISTLAPTSAQTSAPITTTPSSTALVSTPLLQPTNIAATPQPQPTATASIKSQRFSSKFSGPAAIKSAVINLILQNDKLINEVTINPKFDTIKLSLPIAIAKQPPTPIPSLQDLIGAITISPEGADEILILIATFTHADGMVDAKLHEEIRKAIVNGAKELSNNDPKINLRVVVVPSQLEGDEQAPATALGKRYNASFIIWGNETPVRTTVNFLNLKQPNAQASQVKISETERSQMADPKAYVQLVTRDLPNQMRFLALFAVGQAYYQKGKAGYESSFKAIDSAAKTQLPISPTVTGLADAYFRLGSLSYELKQELTQTIKLYDHVVDLDKNYVEAYNNRGIAYRELKQYQRAIQNFDRAIDLDKNYADAYYNRGVTYGDLKQYVRAIQDFDKAIDLDKNFAAAYHNRGLAYNGLTQYERAIQDYNKAIEIDKNYAAAYHNRGLAYNGLTQYERAIQDFDKAIEIDKNYAAAYHNRGLAYNGLTQYERAIQDFDKAIDLDTIYAATYVGRGIAYAKLNQNERAIKDYAKVVGVYRDENSAIAYVGISNPYVNRKQYERAIQDFDKAIDLDTSSANAYYNRGTAYANLRQYERAIQDLNKAISLYRNFVSAYNNRGFAYVNLGQYERAIQDFRVYLALAPNAENRAAVEKIIKDLEAQRP